MSQSKENGSIKQILLRMDLQQKVKQYDGKLSNVVQRFQVCYRFTNPNHSFIYSTDSGDYSNGAEWSVLVLY